jgi:hypothetical protein
MVNFLYQLQNPQVRYEKIFEVMRDYRKGGLTPEIYDEFINTIKELPPLYMRRENHFNIFDKFNLKDLTEEDHAVIMREVIKRGIESTKKCWHPKADTETCSLDKDGKILISAAHSIQNNGVLSKIVENGHVMTYAIDKGEFEGKQIGKTYASIFWGFCNKHDAIFKPIENAPYTKTLEQNFLFAYRGFVVASHKKLEVSSWMDYGEQSDNDIVENKKLFDKAIIEQDYEVIETEVFELPHFYPIAVSSSFYLDYDFEGNPIPHSDERMEDIYVTLLPADDKTYFLLSYFTRDKHLYKNLGEQLRKRNNFKSDITMLIAAHTENIYFNPLYYKTFIEKNEDILQTVMMESQMDFASIDENSTLKTEFSFTPSHYLRNPHGITFFGY